MRIIALYRPHTESEGKIVDYIRDYKIRHPGMEPELLSLDTQEGDDMARLYGVYNNPAILAISHDGSLQQLWQDEQLPLMNEIDAYAFSY